MPEPINPNPTQPVTAPDPDVGSEPISVAQSKEAAPIGVDAGPIQVLEGPVSEYLTPSSPEVAPPPDLAGLVKPTYVAQSSQATINTASAQVVAAQTNSGSFPTTVPDANRIISSKRYSIKDAIKWFATLFKFENLRKQDSTT